MANFPGLDMKVAQNNVDRLGIRYDELPQLPFWARLTGNTNESFKLRVAAKVMAGSAGVGRELTQPEKDALAEHFAQLLRTSSYDNPIALGSAYGFYRYTYAKTGFPFWTPNPEKFDVTKFPGLPKGFLSQKMWHGLRMLSWFAGCKILTGVFCLSYAITQHEKHYSTDPRLQNYRQTIAERRQQMMRQRVGHLGANERPAVPGAPTSSSTTTAGRVPEAWAGGEQSTQDAQSTWPGMQSTQQPESTQAPPDDEPYAFDDASPNAPVEQQQQPQQRSPQQRPYAQGGSAWDRIRSQARGGEAGQSQAQASAGQASAWGRKRQDELTSQGAQDGTSYTFSSADEERAYAKEQAQKEFDQMLERERKGQAGSSKRW